MASKIFSIEGVGDIPIYKHRSAKSVRIRISGSDIKVTIPSWMPYKAAVLYISQKRLWIKQNLRQKQLIYNNMPLGKQHILKLEQSSSSRFSSRISGSNLVIRVPKDVAISSPDTQSRLSKYIHTLLQTEAESLIIPRARKIATNHNFTVNKIEIKNLKSRWGSCSSKQDIAFSLFLIQLPWECIDYVIFHELVHTKHMNHSAGFWNLLSDYVPNYKAIRKQMKAYSPHITVS